MKEKPYGKDLAEYKLGRSLEEMETAELLCNNDKYKAANNRAYYSIYYAITAVLCLEPVAFKRHKDTLGYFNKNYVHTEKFPREIGKDISKAAKVRHASDYDDFYIASKDEAKKQIATAKYLIQLVESFINI
jgi:uncharacterized protein